MNLTSPNVQMGLSILLIFLNYTILVWLLGIKGERIFSKPKEVSYEKVLQPSFLYYFLGGAGLFFLTYSGLMHVEEFKPFKSWISPPLMAAGILLIYNRIAKVTEDHYMFLRIAKRMYVWNVLSLLVLSCTIPVLILAYCLRHFQLILSFT